ncbi:DUF4407 domain-containing protein [Phytohabitans houttuyneae]|uniref:DUF4407 domain-containing protein n=1 Tax=Phytohabitans houttuyneae TaxID=1076126 RepID=A0A6V8K284_9ACTN|nr:DUF4407 domain-containing protein [Phytohabitans houttuyneae]GFJ76279.1 hypothetical protein Phou_004590 [Phytohabitans houttuyneae]
MTAQGIDPGAIGSLEPPPARPARWGLGRVLRLATGVREDVLAHVPSERARYTSMGGVVVGTAVMAMLSMAAALYFVFDGFQPFIVFAVPIWGLFILSIDRWLMSSTSVGQVGRAARKILPRVLLSIALGVIVAEPLLLGIYNTAITEKVAKDRQQEVSDREGALRTCNPIPGTPEASSPKVNEPGCEPFRRSLGGESPQALQAQRDAVQKQVTDLKAVVGDDAEAYAALEEKARRECNGTPGPGLTGRRGEGPNCKRLRTEADRFRNDHKIGDNGKKLADLNTQLAALDERIGKARNNYGVLINEVIQEELAEVRGRQGPVGILERFRALDELVDSNGFVKITQWAIRIFFILIDALPVILKVLSGTTSYDRILEDELRHQERVRQLRSSEDLDRQSRYGDLVRRRTDRQYRTELERINEASRIQLANHDERRSELIDALEEHLLNTATGPASPSWDPHAHDHRVVDMADVADLPTQEISHRDMPGGRW